MSGMTDGGLMVRPELRIQLLGEPQLELDGLRALPGECDKRHLLLYYLAVEGRAEREALATLFWPELPVDAARNNLRQTLHRIRQLFSPSSLPLLDVSRTSVAINPKLSVELDVTRFLRLAESEELSSQLAACDLYGGSFLNDCLPPEGLEAVEEWLFGWRDHLSIVALDLHRRGLEAAQEAGSANLTRRLGEKLVALEPWDEAAHCALIRCYLERGERAAATAQYRALVKALGEELGVSPSREAQELVAGWVSRGEAELAEERVAPPVAAVRERRRVTAVFVEFGALEGSGLDDGPAEMASRVESLSGPRQRVLERFEAAGGHAATLFGSGVLLYFGYPLAREDSARRAVGAALEVLDDCSEARIAIHNGLVITGQEPLKMVGETPAQTVQLRHHAAPGTVVVSAPVHALVSGYYHCQRQTGDDSVWQITGATGSRDRLEVDNRSRTPLVGREAELGQLMDRVAALQRGKSAIVLVEGEPGIGKSRLLQAIIERCPDTIAMRHLRCIESARSSPYWPMLDALRRRSRLDTSASASEQRARFRDYVGELFDDPEPVTRTLWPLLDPAGNQEPNGESILSDVRDALLALVRQLSHHMPILLTLEDVHWADSATLEILEMLSRGFDGNGSSLAGWSNGLLFLVTARSPCPAPWVDGENHLQLSPLAAKAAWNLSSAVAGGRLERGQLEWLVRRCDGIPLYLEEATATLASGGGGGAEETVPSTLQDLLMARIDALGSWRTLAQQAATLGGEFDRPLLAACCEVDPDGLNRGLESLKGQGILESLPGTEGPRYRFRHALLQEAAYRSQLRQDRARTHARVARVIRDDQPDWAEQQPEWLAHHLELGGERAVALEYWCRGAELALRRSALRDGVRHVERGLGLLEKLPSGPERRHEELRLRVLEGTLFLEMEGFGSEQAIRAFERAMALCEQGGVDRELHFYALWGWWGGSSSREESREPSLEVARELLLLAESSGDHALLARSHYAIANNLFFQGDYAGAQREAEIALSFQGAEAEYCFGEDPFDVSRAFLGWSLWYQGDCEGALETTAAAVARARERGRSHDLGMTLAFHATNAFRSRDEVVVAAAVDELLALVDEQRMALWLLVGRVYLGWLRVRAGAVDEGLAIIDGCIEPVREAMASVESFFLMVAADARLETGHHEGLEAILERAVWLEARYGDGYDAAEWRRLRACYHTRVHAEQPGLALECLRQARSVALKQLGWQEALRASRDACLLPVATADDREALRVDMGRVERVNGSDPERLKRNRDWQQAHHWLQANGFDS